MMTQKACSSMYQIEKLSDSKYFYTPIILELVKREFANTHAKVSIEALSIVLCKCTKDCFRYHVQNPAFRITHDWLNDFIRQYKLDELYSVKQNPLKSSYRFEFRGSQSEQRSNESSKSEQSYVVLPGSGIKIYKKKNVKSALQTVDEVIDTISKNGIAKHFYDKISQYNPSKDPVYKDYLPTSARGCEKLLKIAKITKEQVELEMKYANQEISKKFVPGCHNIKYASISQPIKRKPLKIKLTEPCSKKQKSSGNSLQKPLNLLERFSIAKVQVNLNKSSWKKPVMHEISTPPLNDRKSTDKQSIQNKSVASDKISVASDKISVVSDKISVVSDKISVAGHNQSVVSDSSSGTGNRTAVSENKSLANIEQCSNAQVSSRKTSSDLNSAVNGDLHKNIVTEHLSPRKLKPYLSSKVSPRKMSRLQTTNANFSNKSVGLTPVMDDNINSTPEKENKNKRKKLCSERPKNLKKLHLKCQNGSTRFNNSSPLNGFKHSKKTEIELVKSPKKLSLYERFKSAKTSYQRLQNLIDLDSKYQNLKAKIAECLNSDSEEEISCNKHTDYKLLWGSSDSENDSSSEDSNDSGILPLKSVRNYKLKKAPTKFPAISYHVVKKELDANGMKANKVIVVDSSESESSDKDESNVQFPIKCLAQSTSKVPYLKQSDVTAWNISYSETTDVSEDSETFLSCSCENSAVNVIKSETDDKNELLNLYEVLSQSECLNVPLESLNTPMESSILSQKSSNVSQKSPNLPILLPQEQSNQENRGLNRTFIFNNKVLIETSGCYIYQEEIDKAAEYSQYLEDWLDSVTN